MPIYNMAFRPSDLTGFKTAMKKTPKLVLAALLKALKVESKLIYDKSQDLVPVVTGLLRNSGAVERPRKSGLKVEAIVGYKVVKPDKRGRIYDYAPVVEHGRTGDGAFSPRHYMKKAKAATKNGRKKRIASFIRKELKKVRK